MTIGELKARLADYDDNAPIRFLEWPYRGASSKRNLSAGLCDILKVQGTVYLVQGKGIDFAPVPAVEAAREKINPPKSHGSPEPEREERKS